MSVVEGTTGAAAGEIESLYLAHADDAKRLAYLLTGDRSLAEDIAQEAFIRAASRLGLMRDPGRFPAYLRKAVVNMTRMHHRRRRIERRVADSTALRPAVDVGADVAELETLRRALALLKSRQRAELDLRFWSDVSDEEIADT
ncbi:MAG: sigma-70 family RNA polymerase sigma factor, partial [Actinomycetota bacterium]